MRAHKHTKRRDLALALVDLRTIREVAVLTEETTFTGVLRASLKAYLGWRSSSDAIALSSQKTM